MDPILYSSIRDTLTGDTFYWFYQDYINFKPSKARKSVEHTMLIKSDAT